MIVYIVEGKQILKMLKNAGYSSTRIRKEKIFLRERCRNCVKIKW